MKKYLLLFFVLFVTIISSHAQNYKKIKIYIQDIKQVSELAKLDIPIEHLRISKNNTVSVFVTDDEYLKIKRLGYNTEVLIDNWMEYYNKRSQPSETEMHSLFQKSQQQFGVSNFTFGSLNGHLTFTEVLAQLDTMRLKFPSLITQKLSLGKTSEGRDIFIVKITKDADLDNNRPEVLYTALTHAREPEGMMQLIYFMYYLLENYNSDPVVKYLVENRTMYFIPVMNPDGYEYNRSVAPLGGGMWRKNRIKNSDGSYGVDLNRNYGPLNYWNSPNLGSSSAPSSDTYRGTAPFSERETQIIRDLLPLCKIKTALHYHCYGGYLIFPYSALDTETPDSLIFREYASTMALSTNSMYGTDLQTVGYSTRGSSDDYFYDGDTVRNGKIISMTPEIGNDDDGFWAPKERIIPLAMEYVPSNLFIAKAAGAFVKTDNYTFNKPYFAAGEQVKIKTAIKNIGLANASNISIKASSLSVKAALDNNSINVTSLPARSSIIPSAEFVLNIGSTMLPGEQIKVVFTTFIDGYLTNSDTLALRVGMPSFTFTDTSSDISKLWTVTSTPSSAAKWEYTTADYYSAPGCYTDSKNGKYQNSITSIMSLTNPITVAAGSVSYFTFKTKFNIERDYDYGQVEISKDNGATWTALKGTYTRNGVSSPQPIGQPLYDGNMSNWVTEDISLKDYSGMQIKIRFKFVTDSYTNFDGWYVDDIGIYSYTTVPVELNYFKGHSSEKAVALEWQTATETNNYGFEVQREIAEGKYFTIGFIKGNGTSANLNSYSFTDANPKTGTNKYRLKQIDFDNTFRIYEPVSIEYSVPVQFALKQNYPNPFNPATTIDYSIAAAARVTIKIYDVLGNLITELVNENKEAGKYSVQFSADKYGLSSGTYFYKLEAGNFSDTKKFTVLK